MHARQALYPLRYGPAPDFGVSIRGEGVGMIMGLLLLNALRRTWVSYEGVPWLCEGRERPSNEEGKQEGRMRETTEDRWEADGGERHCRGKPALELPAKLCPALCPCRPQPGRLPGGRTPSSLSLHSVSSPQLTPLLGSSVASGRGRLLSQALLWHLVLSLKTKGLLL